jgi:hypothetical protein
MAPSSPDSNSAWHTLSPLSQAVNFLRMPAPLGQSLQSPRLATSPLQPPAPLSPFIQTALLADFSPEVQFFSEMDWEFESSAANEPAVNRASAHTEHAVENDDSATVIHAEGFEQRDLENTIPQTIQPLTISESNLTSAQSDEQVRSQTESRGADLSSPVTDLAFKSPSSLPSLQRQVEPSTDSLMPIASVGEEGYPSEISALTPEPSTQDLTHDQPMIPVVSELETIVPTAPEQIPSLQRSSSGILTHEPAIDSVAEAASIPQPSSELSPGHSPVHSSRELEASEVVVQRVLSADVTPEPEPSESLRAEPLPSEQASLERSPSEPLAMKALSNESLPFEQSYAEKLPVEQSSTKEFSSESLLSEQSPSESLSMKALSNESLPFEQSNSELKITEQLPSEQPSSESLLPERSPNEPLMMRALPFEPSPSEPSPSEQTSSEPLVSEPSSSEPLMMRALPAESLSFEPVPSELLPSESSPIQPSSVTLPFSLDAPSSAVVNRGALREEGTTDPLVQRQYETAESEHSLEILSRKESSIDARQVPATLLENIRAKRDEQAFVSSHLSHPEQSLDPQLDSPSAVPTEATEPHRNIPELIHLKPLGHSNPLAAPPNLLSLKRLEQLSQDLELSEAIAPTSPATQPTPNKPIQTRPTITSPPDTPESWSSLAEMLGKPADLSPADLADEPNRSGATELSVDQRQQSTVQERSIIQKQPELWRQQFDLENESDQKAPANDSENPIAETATSEELVSAWGMTEPEISSTPAPKIDIAQALTDVSAAMTQASLPSDAPAKTLGKSVDEEQFERLARTIYQLIRDRLAVESDRYRHVYSNYPPWVDAIDISRCQPASGQETQKPQDQEPEFPIDPKLSELTEEVYRNVQLHLEIDRERQGLAYAGRLGG